MKIKTNVRAGKQGRSSSTDSSSSINNTVVTYSSVAVSRCVGI